MVVGGNSSQALARKIAKKLKAGYVNTSTRTFPDGESKITIKKIPKKKIILFHIAMIIEVVKIFRCFREKI